MIATHLITVILVKDNDTIQNLAELEQRMTTPLPLPGEPFFVNGEKYIVDFIKHRVEEKDNSGPTISSTDIFVMQPEIAA